MRSPVALLSLSFVALLMGCKSNERTQSAGPAASGVAASSAQGGEVAAISPTSLAVPPDARKADLGVRWLMLRPGTGDPPDLEHQISATVTVWKQDGTSGSNPPGPQPFAFSMYAIPEALRDPMRALQSGAKVRYWFPAAALGTWKPPTWATADLVVDVEVTSVVAPQRVERTVDGKVAPGLEPKPDANPPDEAKVSKLGHRYQRLIAGTGGVQPRKDAKVNVRFSAWRAAGVVVTPIALDQAAGLKLSDAPAAVAEILAEMVQGDVIRIWLTPAAVKGFVTVDGSDKVIVDLGLASIE